MGCGGSSEKGVATQQEESPAEKVHFQVGKNVEVRGRPTVIFVFGGPGSKKGRLVSDLTQTYHLVLINVETIVLKELGVRRQSNADNNDVDVERDVQDDLKEGKSKITLSWILSKIADILKKDSKACYLVDIMPNLRMLSNDSLVQNCFNDLTAFDERYPISFGLHFSLPLDKITRKHDAKVPKIGEAVAGAKSDEADSTRTKKRAALFDHNVKPFLDFFRDAGRLITLDVSNDYESTWKKLCEIFADLELPYYNHPNSVIIVSFEGTELDLIDLPVYQLDLIVMREFVEASDDEEKVLTLLHEIIREKGPTCTNFLVDLRFTCLARCHKFKMETDFTKAPQRSIAFVDQEDIQLDEYVGMRTNGTPCNLNFRVISSPDNRVFLFSRTIDPKLCKRIALFTPRAT